MGTCRATLTTLALLVVASCTEDHRVIPTPVAPTSPRTAPGAVPAAISLVSGNDQEGKAGEDLPHPFVVRVTDANGNGVNHVPVSFQIASGGGTLEGRCEQNTQATDRSTQTNSEGIATMTFRPVVLGRSLVTARVAGLEAPLTFTTNAIVLVIEFWFGYWNIGFLGPCPHSSDVTVPVGTLVEWRIPVEDERYPVTYSVTSTSTPAGAQGFDSGVMTSRDRFRFVPPVRGTWEYRDQITGLTGSLTVK